METSPGIKVACVKDWSLKRIVMDNVREENQQLSQHDETYLCLLSLRDSTGRIVQLYYNYLQLRQAFTGEAPPVLVTMMLALQQKKENLHQKLLKAFPKYMESGKWHQQEVLTDRLNYLSDESKKDLQQICSTEMKLVLLISQMMQS